MTPPAPLHLEDTAAGPPAGSLLVRLADLPDHGGKDIIFTDGPHLLQLLVQRHGGEIYVYENRCPHAGTPLNLFNDRFLDISGKRLICRTHGALFDPQSGLCVRGPCKGDHLRPVAFEVRDGGIYSL
ncbi:Rieske (2Fe-2S) protein [Kordiimonas lacus]|uniref:Ferredoxin subunit of nitrite reductase or a ring-hydroxylating dioxygenase n=1 Tax=Kordiimonas lacus TaxID=637679 RepID=A0A1G6T426_9PROT|nr:Rieske (2Fe-2S) protein [Kordiimonas lacus]SDD23125.1 Ferredoxin subunit of nitrite reductase or a ring-hydroxylating dioxygenase [Kordiimonas lacus]